MQENREKITKDFCRGKILLFFPKTENEAAFIQRQIFSLGFKWCREYGTEVSFLDRCVVSGMELDDGVLYTGPSESDRNRGVLCNSAQFDDSYVAPLTDREMLMAIFNRLAAVEKQQAEILAELRPKILQKPAFEKSGPGTGA